MVINVFVPPPVVQEFVCFIVARPEVGNVKVVKLESRISIKLQRKPNSRHLGVHGLQRVRTVKRRMVGGDVKSSKKI